MSKKKEMTLIAAGMLTGALLLPTAHAAVWQLTATPSTQKVYVDGATVQMEAYNIGGNNYVKLRDVGEAVGFNVYWDGRSVQIDSDAPYTGIGPKGQSTSQATDERGLTYNADGSINVPRDGSKYIPKVGDRVRCDDGYIYEVKDVLRYDNNVFAPGPVGPLPIPTCNWSAFPEVEVPKVEVRHFAHDTGDSMFIRNIYETRRMQYTIYNALGKEPSVWRDGKPLMTIALTIDPADEPYTQTFWPWRASELEKLVHGRPNSHYYVEAWDYYSKGIFQYTRYCVASL